MYNVLVVVNGGHRPVPRNLLEEMSIAVGAETWECIDLPETRSQARDLVGAIDRYRLAHSAFEASGEKTAELNDAYASLLSICDDAKRLQGGKP
jgi:hypothetical protein